MDNIKILNDFKNDLFSILGDQNLQKTFRHQALMLINKYLGVNYLSFAIHETVGRENNFESFLYTITFGITDNLANMYYRKYNMLDPFYKYSSEGSVVELFDLISEDKFIETKYYKEFYSKCPF